MRKALLSAVIGTMTILSMPALADQDHAKKSDPAHTTHMASPHDDHSFTMQMVQHHRDGIAMADAVIANGTNDDVKSMARRIKSDQQKDIATLEAHKGHAQAGKPSKMAMSPKDPDMQKGMAQLKTAKGAEADRLFLELMIVHHAHGLMMAHAAKPRLGDGELKSMANDMFAKQAREIGELQRLHESNRSAQR